MEHMNTFGDRRILEFCTYCSAKPDTRDHVPPKAFLDNPLPNDLPVVPSCSACNTGASLDEEYAACALESVICGSVDPADMRRAKIGRALSRSPALAERISRGRAESENGVSFAVEEDRFTAVLLKAARGHALWELHQHMDQLPTFIGLAPLMTMDAEQLAHFEDPSTITGGLWPEVGSRAMSRLCAHGSGSYIWNVVQPGRYRFLAATGDRIVIRMVLSEYLACEIAWNH